MPSFSSSLEKSIHSALKLANERNHELATLEHLLLALLDEKDASNVLNACNVNIDLLRNNIENFLNNELGSLVTEVEGSEAVPTTGFQRVIQRAAIHVQSSGRNVRTFSIGKSTSSRSLFSLAFCKSSRVIDDVKLNNPIPFLTRLDIFAPHPNFCPISWQRVRIYVPADQWTSNFT